MEPLPILFLSTFFLDPVGRTLVTVFPRSFVPYPDRIILLSFRPPFFSPDGNDHCRTLEFQSPYSLSLLFTLQIAPPSSQRLL